MAHTPLPWQWIGFERHPSLITTVPEKPNGPKLTLAQFIEPADAEFAVHCVMCHADLLAALRELRAAFAHVATSTASLALLDRTSAAIAKAEVEQQAPDDGQRRE